MQLAAEMELDGEIYVGNRVAVANALQDVLCPHTNGALCCGSVRAVFGTAEGAIDSAMPRI